MLLTGHVAPTEQEIRTFRRDGVVVLRGVLAGHEVDALRGGVAEVVARPGPLAVQVSGGGDDGDFFLEDFRKCFDAFWFIFNSLMLAFFHLACICSWYL